MTALSNPFGFRPAYHPSGTIRIETLRNGINSGFATAIFSNTPIKFDNTGANPSIVPVTTTANDPCVGVFCGCEFQLADGSRMIVSPYWPASQTYLADGTMEAYYTYDPNIIYEVQAVGSVAQTGIGQAANVQQNSQGNTFTGLSTQQLSALTGATAGTFQVVGLADTNRYGPNQWGDAFTIVRVRIANWNPLIA